MRVSAVSTSWLESRHGVAGAVLAAPQLDALLGSGSGDDQGGNRVKEPEAGAACQQTHKPDRALGGAQQILGALASGRIGLQTPAETMLGPSEQGHEHDARRQQRDRQPIALGLAAREEFAD